MRNARSWADASSSSETYGAVHDLWKEASTPSGAGYLWRPTARKVLVPGERMQLAPRVALLDDALTASLSTKLAIGDAILSVNGINKMCAADMTETRRRSVGSIKLLISRQGVGRRKERLKDVQWFHVVAEH